MNLCKVSVSPSNCSKALPMSLSLTVSPHSSSVGKNLIPSSPFSLPFYSLICMLHFTILQLFTIASSSLFSCPTGEDREGRLGEPPPRRHLCPGPPRLISTCSRGMSSEAVRCKLAYAQLQGYTATSFLVADLAWSFPHRFLLRNVELLNFSHVVWNYRGQKRGKTVQMKKKRAANTAF